MSAVLMIGGFYRHFKKPENFFNYMPERKNPETSNEAWRSITTADLNDIYKKIIDALNVLGEGTFEEIAAVAMVDKSRVWKRLSEMQRMELCYRPGKKKKLKSGRNGFTWMLCANALKKTEATIKSPSTNTKQTSVSIEKQIAFNFT